jgi:ribosomal protein L44E
LVGILERERGVVVRNLKGRKAISSHQQMESDKRLCVEYDDLAMEQRQIRRDGNAKRGKRRPRAGKKAKLVVKQVRSDLSCTQASSDVEHTSVLEACEETPRSTGTICDSGPSHRSETPVILGHRAECLSITNRSKIDSQTDSTSSQDATDWEDDSDSEDSSKILQFQPPSFLEERSETGLSLLQIELSPMKSRLIENLMLDFWAIFDSSWPHSMRQHGSSDQSTVSTTASESGTTSRDSSSVRYGKRSRSDDGEDEESDDLHERRRKRAPVDKLPAVREDDSLARQFACPFRKHDPRKYSIQKWPRCAEKPQKTIARLK